MSQLVKCINGIWFRFLSFFFFPQNNMCILISQSRGLMEQDKLSHGFSSRQSTLSLTNSSFIYPLPMSCLLLVSLFPIAPKYGIPKILGNVRDKYYIL